MNYIGELYWVNYKIEREQLKISSLCENMLNEEKYVHVLMISLCINESV